MTERFGPYTILVNRAAGFVSVCAPYQQGQFDEASLRSWIVAVEPMVNGEFGAFYGGQLDAHRRALALLVGAVSEVSDVA